MKKIFAILAVAVLSSSWILAQESKCETLLKEFRETEMKQWKEFMEKLKQGLDAVPPIPDSKRFMEIQKICNEEIKILEQKAETEKKAEDEAIYRYCRLRTTEGPTNLCKGIPPDPVNLKKLHDICNRMTDPKPDLCSKLIPLPKQ